MTPEPVKTRGCSSGAPADTPVPSPSQNSPPPKPSREISRREGLDFATALLYDRVLRAPESSLPGFMSKVNKLLTTGIAHVRRFRGFFAGIVPAAFYKQNPKSGADGRLVREAAQSLGLRNELVPVSAAGSLAENAQVIRDWLTRHRRERVILISLCKGGADVKYAFNTCNTAADGVVAWLNICGTLSGSPVAEWLLATKPRRLLAWLYCRSKGAKLDFLHELVPSASGPLSTPLRVPPETMRLVNIVGFPTRRHLTNRFHAGKS